MSILFVTGLIIFSISFHSLYAQDISPITIEIKKSELEGCGAMLSELADEISYVKLETTSNALIGDAKGNRIIKIPYGFLVWGVMGAGRIMAFHSNGEFNGFIGNVGQGPGEYMGMYKVYYDQYLDNILVLSTGKVLRYKWDGTFISSIDIEISDGGIWEMSVRDNDTWLFTYNNPIKELLFEVGVIVTNKEGEIIQKYNLTDETQPGSYFHYSQVNHVHQWGNKAFYSPYDYKQIFIFTKEDKWLPYINIKTPFKKTPIDLFKINDPPRLNKALRENGRILSSVIYGEKVFISGATPLIFGLLVNLNSNLKLYSGYEEKFKKVGYRNDIDGGMPFRIRDIDSEGIAIEMIDAIKLLDYADKGLLKPDGKGNGPNLNLKEIVETTKPDDNPIVVVVHMKE